MSTSFYAYLVLGFPVEEKDFRTRGRLLVECPSGHGPEHDGQKFCPKCGTKFVTKAELVPTQALKNWAALYEGVKLEDAYEAMFEEYTAREASLHKVNGRDESPAIVFGVKLAEWSDYKGRASSCSMGKLQEMAEAIVADAKGLGLSTKGRSVAVYLVGEP
jgi:hypothetical protein